MTLLSICVNVAPKLGIRAPSSIIGNSSAEAQLLLALAQEEGNLLARRYVWNRLRKEYTFNTIAGHDQGSASVPTDLDRFVPGTFYNRTRRREIFGPVTPQDWQAIMADQITAIDPCFIMRGGAILIAPEQGEDDVIAYEYVSNKWAISDDGVPRAQFVDDADTTIWPDYVLQLGMEYRYKLQKGYEHRSVQLLYEQAVANLAIADGSKPIINTRHVRGSSVKPGRAMINDFNTIPTS